MARKRVLDLTAASTLSKNQSGALITLNAAAGFAVKLPSPGRGLEYDFVVKTSATHDTTHYTIEVPSVATASMKGNVLSGANAGAPAYRVSSGASKLAIGTAAGGLIGTHIKVICNNDSKWEVTGIVVGATNATIFE